MKMMNSVVSRRGIMKSVVNPVTAVLAMALTFSGSLQAEQDDVSVKAEVLAVDRQVDTAEAELDVKTLQHIYSKDFVHVHVGASMIDDKKSEPQNMAPKGFYL